MKTGASSLLDECGIFKQILYYDKICNSIFDLKCYIPLLDVEEE